MIKKTVAEFQVRVRKAARYCNFGKNLEENLLEQFISGVNHVSLVRKLVESENVVQFSYLYFLVLETRLEMAVLAAPESFSIQFKRF